MTLCTKCNIFPKKKTNPWCNECSKEYERGRWSKLSLRKKREKWLKTKYKLTYEEYESIYKSQNGLCAICEVEISLEKTDNSHQCACVDHCHKTGKIRGLLCNHCNRALGLLKENKQTILYMVDYLDKHN